MYLGNARVRLDPILFEDERRGYGPMVTGTYLSGKAAGKAKVLEFDEFGDGRTMICGPYMAWSTSSAFCTV
jgi:hypothetical protein